MAATLTCPVCRAANTAGPDCRRCKADLSLLWDLEAERALLLADARAAAADGDWAAAADWLDAAHALRRGPDTARLRVAVRLMLRDFAGARDCLKLA